MRKSHIKDDVLREICGGKRVSGGLLAAKLGVSRTAVWKTVNALRADGFFIDGGVDGYVISPFNMLLCAEQAQALIDADRVYFKNSTGSTNEDIKTLAESGAEEFTLVLAQRQTNGKGRLSRSFYSPPGGLYFSVLLRPGHSAQTSLKITTAAAVAMAKAIESVTNQAVKIKWVNDIYIKEKKVCGILTEGAIDAENGRLKYAVLGIGVNVATPKGGFCAEIKDKAGAVFEAASPPSLVYFALINAFLKEFKDYYKCIDSMPHIEQYRSRNMLSGRKVTYEKNGKSYTATVCGIGENAELIVKTGGKEIPLLSGEVNLKSYE